MVNFVLLGRSKLNLETDPKYLSVTRSLSETGLLRLMERFNSLTASCPTQDSSGIWADQVLKTRQALLCRERGAASRPRPLVVLVTAPG